MSDMTALDKLRKKADETAIEYAILYLARCGGEIHAEDAAAELAAKDARIARLEATIYAVRNGEYDNAHDITAARKFLFEAMQEYNAALAGEQ